MPKAAEFILEFEAKQVLVLEPFGPYYEDAIKRLSEQPDLQVVQCSSLQEMVLLGRQIGVCLMLAHCHSAEEAEAFTDLLRNCYPEIRARKIRIVITAGKDFVTLQTRFIREGAAEVIQQPISPKMLYRKIDRFLEILPSRDKYGKLIAPRPRKRGTGDDLSEEPLVTWRQAMSLQSDCWMAIEGKARWVPGAKKWSVTLIGPPPQYGEWCETEPVAEQPVPQPEEPTWEWIPSELTDDPFIKDEGAWKFRGEKPEFKNGAWTFKAYHPKLAFISARVNKGTKVEGSPEELSLAENSEQAIKACETIERALLENARVEEHPDDPDYEPQLSARELHPKPDSEPEPVNSQPPPEYLHRLEPETADSGRSHFDSSQASPLAAALLVSEMIQSRKFSPKEILQKFCAYLKRSSSVEVAEVWVLGPKGWQCVDHDDLMDMALQQKLQAVRFDSHACTTDRCAHLLEYQGHPIGALVVSGGIFGNQMLGGLAKAITGVLVSAHRELKKAA